MSVISISPVSLKIQQIKMVKGSFKLKKNLCISAFNVVLCVSYNQLSLKPFDASFVLFLHKSRTFKQKNVIHKSCVRNVFDI